MILTKVKVSFIGFFRSLLNKNWTDVMSKLHNKFEKTKTFRSDVLNAKIFLFCYYLTFSSFFWLIKQRTDFLINKSFISNIYYIIIYIIASTNTKTKVFKQFDILWVFPLIDRKHFVDWVEKYLLFWKHRICYTLWNTYFLL